MRKKKNKKKLKLKLMIKKEPNFCKKDIKNIKDYDQDEMEISISNTICDEIDK